MTVFCLCLAITIPVPALRPCLTHTAFASPWHAQLDVYKRQPVEHGVDAEHHGVRQLMPVFRVLADTALVFQFSVQLLDVHAGHPGDNLVSQIGLDVAPDELLITCLLYTSRCV